MKDKSKKPGSFVEDEELEDEEVEEVMDEETEEVAEVDGEATFDEEADAEATYDEDDEEFDLNDAKKAKEKKGDALSGFRARVAIESLTKATLFAVMVMLVTVVLECLVLNLFQARISLAATLISAGILGIGSLIGSFMFFWKKIFQTHDVAVATRVDGLGLDERAVTMVEHAHDDSFIAQKQREDANGKLVEIEPKQVKYKIPKLAIALLVAVLCFCIPILPMYNRVVASDAELAANKAIAEMIIRLRDTVKDSKVSTELKDELYDIIDDCEKDCKSTIIVRTKKQIIIETSATITKKINDYINDLWKKLQGEIDERVQAALTTINNANVSDAIKDQLRNIVNSADNEIAIHISARDWTFEQVYDRMDKAEQEIQALIDANQKEKEDIAEELEKPKNPALDKLADAIKNNDAQKADDALEELKKQVEESAAPSELITEISDAIKAATEKAEAGKLKDAMSELTNGLEAAKTQPTDEAKKTEAEKALESAKQPIKEALEEAAAEKKAQEEVKKALEEAKAAAEEAKKQEETIKETEKQLQDIIKETTEKPQLNPLENSGSGSGGLSGDTPGSNSGSGSGGSGSTKGSTLGSTPGSGSGSGMSGSGSTKGSTPGSTPGSASGSGMSGSGGKSGSTTGNPGSNSGSGSADGQGTGVISDSPPETVIDGKTPYTSVYEYYIRMANWYTANGEEVPEWIAKMINIYGGAIEPTN